MASRPAATRHPSQLLTLGIGAIYTLVGLLAFVVTGDFAAKTDKALLGLELNPVYNLMHLLIGLAGLVMWRWLNIVRTYGWLLLAGYGLVFVFGRFAAGNPDVTFLSLNAAGNVLHLVSALAGAAIALWPTGGANGRHPAAPRVPDRGHYRIARSDRANLSAPAAGRRQGKEVFRRLVAACRPRKGNDMGRRAVVLLALLLALALTVLAAPAATATTVSSTVLSARLTGEAEVPGPGDPNGVGSARIRLGERRVCFTLHWSRIAPPTAAHIHVGPPGMAGPVVVPLFAAPGGLPPELSGVSGCVAGVDPALIRAIRQHPRQYYVNIHNVPFPDGAIRGQLHRADN
jgi:hypothetical protein